MAGYFAWRQMATLRQLRTAENLSAEDRRYTRRQAVRRLICSVLMVVLAGMHGLSFALEEPAQALVAHGQAARERGEEPRLDPEQQRFFDLYSAYWIIALLVLLAIIVLAAIDFFAIRS